MFENHFGLRENPFVAGHQSRLVYPSREHQEALAHLRFGTQNFEPCVLIRAEVGTGKTTALYDALGQNESRAVGALLTNSSAWPAGTRSASSRWTRARKCTASRMASRARSTPSQPRRC